MCQSPPSNPAHPLSPAWYPYVCVSVYVLQIIQNDTRTPVFTAALFTITRTWEQSKCPSTDEWIKQMWFIYTIEYYSAVRWRRQWHPLHTLVWRIPWTEEPGGLQSMGSLGVGHDWATSLSVFTFLHWRRPWQPTPVFLPGESQGRGSLVGCRLWGRTESEMTEVT